MFWFGSLFELALAAYLFILAIRGKGRIIENPYIKKGKEAQYKKIARIGLFSLAGLLVLLGGVGVAAGNISQESPAWDIIGPANFVISILVLTAMMALFLILRAMQDKEKRKNVGKPPAPRAAFFFDEEERDKAVPAAKTAPKRKK